MALTAYGGDYLDVVAEIMNEMPMRKWTERATYRLPMWHRIEAVTDPQSFDGEYAKILMHTNMSRNARPRLERGVIAVPVPDTFAEQRVRLSQYMGSIGWTKEEARRAVTRNGAAILNLIDLKTKGLPIDMQQKLDFAFSTDKTGRLARVASYSAGSSTGVVTVDNAAAEFGWNKADWVRNGQVVDIYTVPDITGTDAWTLKAKNCIVSEVNYSAGTFRITTVTGDSLSTIAVSPADHDFVFIADSVSLTTADKFSAWTGCMGLLGIVDDGACAGHEFHNGSSNAYNGNWSGVTFQNLTRTSYPELISLVRRAGDWATGGTDGTPETADWRTVERTVELIDTGMGGGEVSALFLNAVTMAWLRDQGAAMNNVMKPVTDGKFTPGLSIDGVFMRGRRIPCIEMNTIPNGTIIGGDEKDLLRYVLTDITWEIKDGNIIFDMGLRNRTQESQMIAELQLGAYRTDNWFRLEDINVSDYD